ncbi:adenosine kinase [Gluconobacter morbifer]|uniref:Putative sugar kinase protein n=1 Tax=Gluconobacter morbifer G707 TaxID=1088869 RepID=G6XF36_9PROT|nr:adenosine kinase [Gluconobacter morbifer]EHH68794.1 putative sugar kinase protein [Gluconobacter morbifer G707]
MSTPQHDLLCIGNAIVDVLASVDQSVAEKLGAAAGSMTLIDAPTAHAIEQHVTVERIAGGGSGANTAVVAARMGAKVAYLGKVAADEAGTHFARDMQEQGLTFPSQPLPLADDIPTARCIVLVTPDGQRTMFTYLGACTEFTPEDVHESVVADAAITYLEGYLYDKPHAQAAFEHAAKLARKAGRQVALTLSDTFCVERHRAAFRALVAGHVDILFANEAELLALYEVSDFEDALRQVGTETQLAAITRGEKGAVVISSGERHDVPTSPVSVVDTTGAGDAFAAGFLAGLSRRHDLVTCAKLGNQAAGEIITRFGARPEDDFSLRA